ncbi:hydroxysteroid dehydrogenase-like protein 1 [Ochlerotatus camptorhynchus]|uniref:hydroxysteroid dehydrogenase-like protein 1 n=1 Tax=Ochlerotatus camptorhynchus TaxID=644619 RepID=UPI0031D9DB9C
MMLLLLFLAIIGAYAAAWWLLENLILPLFRIVWGTLKQPLCGKKSLAERYGRWAVITGATDGIGKGYAVHLARKGMNLVLISRSEAKLIKVSREIQIDTGVQIKLIVADFSKGDSIYDRIGKELEPVDVGILVNNVGMASDRMDHFENHRQQHYLQMVNVNVLSVLMMTHIVLPKMKQAGRGIIINISSGTAKLPAPYITAYSASKSFGHNFTLALQQELRGSGVECQLVVPGFVRTNMVDAWDVTRFGGKLIPDANQFGASATWLIGKSDCTSGHWYQGTFMLLTMLVPQYVRMRVNAAIFKHLMDGQHVEVKRTSL